MKYIKLFSIMLIVALGLLCSCGDNEGEDEPEVITRAQDSPGTIFLENGIIVDANNLFTESELKTALISTPWTPDYHIIYDNNSISDKKPETNEFRVFDSNGKTGVNTFNLKLSYYIRDNILVIWDGKNKPLSSFMPYQFVIISVDPDRIVIDDRSINHTKRIVWVPYVPEGDTQE